MEIKQVDGHKHWKHVASSKLYNLMGYGVWKGGVNDPGVDMAQAIAYRPAGADGLSDLEAVPGHYQAPADVKHADLAIVQTNKPLQNGDHVAVYVGDFYETKNAVFVRRYEDFIDGRFVKVDAEGKELPAVKLGATHSAVSAALKSELSKG